MRIVWSRMILLSASLVMLGSFAQALDHTPPPPAPTTTAAPKFTCGFDPAKDWKFIGERAFGEPASGAVAKNVNQIGGGSSFPSRFVTSTLVTPFVPDRKTVVTYSFVTSTIVFDPGPVANHLNATLNPISFTYTGAADLNAVKALIREAIESWNDTAGIVLQEDTSGNGQILVGQDVLGGSIAGLGGFLAGSGDGKNWNNTSGFVQLDSSTVWSAALLRAVACHECGHAIGMQHTQLPTVAVMNPTANTAIVGPQADDRWFSQFLYGVTPARLSGAANQTGLITLTIRKAAPQETGTPVASAAIPKPFGPGNGTGVAGRNNVSGYFVEVGSGASPSSWSQVFSNLQATTNGNNADPTQNAAFNSFTFTDTPTSGGIWTYRVKAIRMVSGSPVIDSLASDTVTVNFTAVGITSLNPPNLPISTGGFALTINGSNFDPLATVKFGTDAGLVPTSNNGLQIVVNIPVGDVPSAGQTVTVEVDNPDLSFGSTTFDFNNPTPTLSSLDITTKTVGNSTFSITATGTNIVSTSVLQFDGIPLGNRQNVTSSTISSDILDTQMTVAGTHNITIFNPAPPAGGLPSNIKVFTVNNPVPVLTSTSLSPAVVVKDTPGFTLTVSDTGNSYVSTSVVNWNGTPLATAFVTSGQLTAVVPASLLHTAGPFPITVTTPGPGGGTSGSQNVFVDTPPVAVIAAPLTSPPYADVVTAFIPFDATGSSDADAGETASLTYAWDFGDGTTGAGNTPPKAYSVAGTYLVKLVVTDVHGISSAPAFVTVTMYGPVDDTVLVANTASFFVNRTGGNRDTFTLGGILNPRSLPATLTGKTLTVSVGSQSLFTGTLDSHGTARAANYSISLNAANGALSVSGNSLNFVNQVPAPDTTARGSVGVLVSVAISGGSTYTNTLNFDYLSIKGTSVRGTYSALVNSSTSGAFQVSRILVQDIGGGKCIFTVSGRMEQGGGGALIPDPANNVNLFVASASQMVITPPSRRLLGSGGVGGFSYVPTPAVPGLSQFLLTNPNHTFTFKTAGVTGSGVPAVGVAAATTYNMQLSITVDTAYPGPGTNLSFTTNLQIRRSASTSAVWIGP